MASKPDFQNAIAQWAILGRLFFILALALSAAWAVASAMLASYFLQSEDGKLISAALWIWAMLSVTFAITVRKVRRPTPIHWASATLCALPGLVILIH